MHPRVHQKIGGKQQSPTGQLCYTQLFHTQLCHTQPFTHTHTTLSQTICHTHTTLSHTTLHIQLFAIIDPPPSPLSFMLSPCRFSHFSDYWKKLTCGLSGPLISRSFFQMHKSIKARPHEIRREHLAVDHYFPRIMVGQTCPREYRINIPTTSPQLSTMLVTPRSHQPSTRTR